MNRAQAAGVALAGVGVAGYAAGTVLAYPGRELSLAAVMVGATLALVGGGRWP